MNASLYTKIPGRVSRAGLETQDVDVELCWDRADPCALTIGVTESGRLTPWECARSLVLASVREPMRGAWVGYSDVACHAGPEHFRFAFYPRRPRPVFLRLPVAGVVDFIEHTERVLPSHGIEEQVIVLADMERSLAEILAG